MGVETGGGGRVERASAMQQSEPTTLGQASQSRLAARPPHRPKKQHGLSRPARTVSTLRAWSCSNPDHDDPGSSKAWSCSIPSPVPASSENHSRMRTPPATQRSLQPTLASQTSFTPNYSPHGIGVKARSSEVTPSLEQERTKHPQIASCKGDSGQHRVGANAS